jgi:hypothetical protein
MVLKPDTWYSSKTDLIPGIDGSDVARESVGWISPNQGVDLYIGTVPNFAKNPLKIQCSKFARSELKFNIE